jgi:hypothetical protein
MSKYKVAITLTACGIAVMSTGGLLLLASGHENKGSAALAFGIGFALVCFGQAARKV